MSEHTDDREWRGEKWQLYDGVYLFWNSHLWSGARPSPDPFFFFFLAWLVGEVKDNIQGEGKREEANESVITQLIFNGKTEIKFDPFKKITSPSEEEVMLPVAGRRWVRKSEADYMDHHHLVIKVVCWTALGDGRLRSLKPSDQPGMASIYTERKSQIWMLLCLPNLYRLNAFCFHEVDKNVCKSFWAIKRFK